MHNFCKDLGKQESCTENVPFLAKSWKPCKIFSLGRFVQIPRAKQTIIVTKLKELEKEEEAKQSIQEVTERKTIENSKKNTDVENPDPVYEANPNFPGTNVHYRLYVIWFV